MTYKCPQCGHTSEQPGNCSACNIPMTEVAEETPTKETPTEPQQPEQPSA